VPEDPSLRGADWGFAWAGSVLKKRDARKNTQPKKTKKNILGIPGQQIEQELACERLRARKKI